MAIIETHCDTLSPTLSWRLSSEGRLYGRDDEALAVYFDGASGDTHLVDSRSVVVLEALHRRPETPIGLAQALQESSTIDSRVGEEPDWLETVLDILSDLHAFDIVEPE